MFWKPFPDVVVYFGGHVTEPAARSLISWFKKRKNNASEVSMCCYWSESHQSLMSCKSRSPRTSSWVMEFRSCTRCLNSSRCSPFTAILNWWVWHSMMICGRTQEQVCWCARTSKHLGVLSNYAIVLPVAEWHEWLIRSCFKMPLVESQTRLQFRV